jgi:hypothetical protein
VTEFSNKQLTPSKGVILEKLLGAHLEMNSPDFIEKCQYHVYNRKPLDPALSQMNETQSRTTIRADIFQYHPPRSHSLPPGTQIKTITAMSPLPHTCSWRSASKIIHFNW